MELSAEKKGGREEECVPSAQAFFFKQNLDLLFTYFPTGQTHM